MASSAPSFRYHPDPQATGSATALQHPCALCEARDGLVYTGPIYGKQPDAPICVACIEDGSASEKLGYPDFLAAFTDVGGPECDDIPNSILDEIAHRTPGFNGWQQEHWLYHCGDGAAYLGRIGFTDLEPLPDARESLVQEGLGFGLSRAEVEDSLRNLHPDGNATGYLFRCLRCAVHLAYSDLS